MDAAGRADQADAAVHDAEFSKAQLQLDIDRCPQACAWLQTPLVVETLKGELTDAWAPSARPPHGAMILAHPTPRSRAERRGTRDGRERRAAHEPASMGAVHKPGGASWRRRLRVWPA
jgi:hypothetical protein